MLTPTMLSSEDSNLFNHKNKYCDQGLANITPSKACQNNENIYTGYDEVYNSTLIKYYHGNQHLNNIDLTLLHVSTNNKLS